VLNIFISIDINFTNAHIQGLRKLESCRRLTACLHMDFGPLSIVLLEATNTLLQIGNYMNHRFIFVLNIVWHVTGEKTCNEHL
jgi:hypothetical protein